MAVAKRRSMDVSEWREASSLIILSRPNMMSKVKSLSNVLGDITGKNLHHGNSRNYDVLMVKRNSRSSHLANFFVFPGGAVDANDYSSSWWKVFQALNISRSDLRSFGQDIRGRRPPVISNPRTLESELIDDPLPADVAMRITALRETFEETGILLLRDAAGRNITADSLSIDVKWWQEAVHTDSHWFVYLCISLNACPDIWSLYEWSNWMSPASSKFRRYDTLFYLCCISRAPRISVDKNEITETKWLCYEDVMGEENGLLLAPPQIYELSRIFCSSDFKDIKLFAEQRQIYGCERLVPILVPAADGIISLLPGDDGYSESPEDHFLTISEMRKKVKNLHRIEIQYPTFAVRCNIRPVCGHKLLHTDEFPPARL